VADDTEDGKLQRLTGIDAGKAVARKGGEKELREGEKPSAPANLVLPKPVKVPVAPNKSEKE